MTGRSQALLACARDTPGFLSEEEGQALSRLARRAARTGAGVLLEVGSYQGRSTLYLAAGLAAALEEGAPPTLLFSVDHHRGSEEMQAGWPHHQASLVDPATGRMDSLPAFRRNLEAAGAEDLVAAVVGDSPALAAAWAGGLALLFLDGGHGEEPAWADYRGWSPLVVPGGLLAFHDVFPDPADGGRPPYECYLDALAGGAFAEEVAARCGSLRVLRRAGAPGAHEIR